MDLDKYKQKNTDKAILKLRDENPVTESKIKNWSTVHGFMPDGNEVFVSLPDEELRKAPEKAGYIDLTGLCVVKRNKANKMYLEPVIQKPARETDFVNPWAEEAKK